MKQLFFLFFITFYFSSVFSQEEAKSRTYSEKLKEAYSEKLKKSKELFDKGVKVASEKYSETFVEGKNLSGKSKEWLMKDLQNIGDWEYKNPGL